MKMNLFFNIISVLNQSFDFTQSLTLSTLDTNMLHGDKSFLNDDPPRLYALVGILVLTIALMFLFLVCLCKDRYMKQKNLNNNQIIFSIFNNEDMIFSYDDALKNSIPISQSSLNDSNDYKLPSYDENMHKMTVL